MLRRAYVEARYAPHYKITAGELAWVDERIALLQDLAHMICEERPRALERTAA